MHVQSWYLHKFDFLDLLAIGSRAVGEGRPSSRLQANMLIRADHGKQFDLMPCNLEPCWATCSEA